MTGDEPPSPTDPDTPVIEAVSMGTGQRYRYGCHAVAHPAHRGAALGERNRQ